jgi:hypothetical protein
MILFIFIQWD